MGLDKCTARRLPIWQMALFCRDGWVAWFGGVWGAMAGLAPSIRCARAGARGGFDLRRPSVLMELGHFGTFWGRKWGLGGKFGFVLRRRAGMFLWPAGSSARAADLRFKVMVFRPIYRPLSAGNYSRNWLDREGKSRASWIELE